MSTTSTTGRAFKRRTWNTFKNFKMEMHDLVINEGEVRHLDREQRPMQGARDFFSFSIAAVEFSLE